MKIKYYGLSKPSHGPKKSEWKWWMPFVIRKCRFHPVDNVHPKSFRVWVYWRSNTLDHKNRYINNAIDFDFIFKTKTIGGE